MNKRYLMGLILLVFLAILSGCGKREIDDLALVLAVGIDQNEQHRFVVSAEIARPGDARGQTGAPAGGTGEPIWTAIGEGNTIFEAIRNLGRFSSRRIFWAHNKIIVIHEQVARRGITDIIDFFSRNHELRMRTWIAVSEDPASQIVSSQTGLEVIPGNSLDKLFRYSQIVSEAPRVDMRTLEAAYLSETTHPFLPRLALKDRVISTQKSGEFGSKQQVELSGSAVFKRDKMVGWLTPGETRGMLWFVEVVDSGVVTLSCPGGNGMSTLELRKGDFSVTPQYQQGEISFQVRLHAYLDLVEMGCPSPLEHAEILDRKEEAAASILAKEIQAVLDKAQHTYGVDFLELGKTFQNRYPYEFRQIKAHWMERFPQVRVEVNVTAEINSPVLLENPTRPGK